ncbi:FKBP-type peptidyl-prolyl cis-trans isomerase [Methanomassiliicoccaceae archaeon COG_1]|nr:FKBP-type peptidyl-prolyl cis-trans isomerase [Methanomassiliicoccaceae archaeon COG_1]
MASGEEEAVTRKKGREPILTICFIALAIASIVVIAAYVDDHYLRDNRVSAETGDTLMVDYTGSFYNYYDEGGVIFQTTVKSIDGNSDYLKSSGYSFNNSKLSVTLGKGSMLAGFENALKGAKEGETIRVEIPAGEGYTAAGGVTKVSGVQTSPLSYTMTVDEFKAIYGFPLSNSAAIAKDATFGWPAIATLDNATAMVTVTCTAKAGGSYSAETSYGTIKTSVTAVSGSDVSYTISLSGYKTTGEKTASGLDEIQMIKAFIGGRTVYITGVGEGGSVFEYKTCNENANEKLFFVIRVDSIKSA